MSIEALKNKVREEPLSPAAYLKLARALRESEPPRLQEALAACNAARCVYPMNPVVLVTTGVLEAELGDVEKARATLKLVTESPLGSLSAPDLLACALFALAKCAHSQMLHDEAETLLRKCMQVEPSHLAARVMLASLQEERRELHAASLTLKQACQECAHNEDKLMLGQAYMSLARVLHQLDMMNDALTYYRLASEVGYREAEALMCLARLSVHMKRWDEAASTLKRVLLLDEKNAEALELLAIAQFAAGNATDAESLWRSRLDVGESNVASANLGVLAQKRGDPEFFSLYEKSLKRVAVSEPSGSEADRAPKKSRQEATNTVMLVHNNIAVELLQRRLFSLAHAALLVASQHEGDNANVLYNLAMVHVSERRYGDAVQLFLLVVHARPRFAAAHNNMGVALHRLGHLNFALECYSKAHALAPDTNQYSLNVARALLDLDDPNEARSVLMRCRHDAEKLALVAALSLVNGEPSMCVTVGLQSLELKETAEAIYFIGCSYQKLGKLKEAMEAYRRLLYLEPTHAFCQHNLGVVLMQQGKVKEAVPHFQRAIQLEPGFSAAYCSLGHAFTQLLMGQEAVIAFQASIDLKPNAPAYKLWGDVLVVHGQVEGALRCYRIACQLDGTQADVHLQMGLLFEHLKKYDDAAMAYHSALSVDKQNLNALCALGFLTARSSKESQRKIAIKCFKLLTSLDSKHPAAKWFKGVSSSDPDLLNARDHITSVALFKN